MRSTSVQIHSEESSEDDIVVCANVDCGEELIMLTEVADPDGLCAVCRSHRARASAPRSKVRRSTKSTGKRAEVRERSSRRERLSPEHSLSPSARRQLARRAAATTSSTSSSSSSAPSPSTPAPTLVSHSRRHFHGHDDDERNDRRSIHPFASTSAPVVAVADDVVGAEHAVLGAHLFDLHSAMEIEGMNAWRDAQGPPRGREIAFLQQSKDTIGFFTGTDDSGAAMFIKRFTHEVYTQRYSTAQALRLCVLVLKDLARTWFDERATHLGVRPIVEFLTQFRRRWLAPRDRARFINVVRDMRLESRGLDDAKLQQYHGDFLRAVENAQAADKAYSNDLVVSDYFSSLPITLQDYLGDSWDQRYSSTVQVTRACSDYLLRRGSRANSSSVSSTMAGAVNSSRSFSRDRPQRGGRGRSGSSDDSGSDSSADDGRGRVCYHCAQQGHIVGQCPAYLEGREQNAAGAAAYLSDRRRFAQFRPYDAKFWGALEPRQFREVRRSFSYTNGGSSSPAVPVLAPAATSSMPRLRSAVSASSSSSPSPAPARHMSSSSSSGRFTRAKEQVNLTDESDDDAVSVLPVVRE